MLFWVTCISSSVVSVPEVAPVSTMTGLGELVFVSSPRLARPRPTVIYKEMPMAEQQHVAEATVRPLREEDLEAADRIMRTAFGTFMGAPDPVAVFGDAQYVVPRYRAEPDWAFAAELEGEVAGSNFATRWGSFGFFGPLTVRPDLWDRGIAGRLMEPIIELFEEWRVRQAGLFTFAQSPKHIGLYQKFGFWPQYLTALMDKRIEPAADAPEPPTLASAPEAEREGIIAGCAELTDSIYDGLDVLHEIRATDAQSLGETVLLGGAELEGFAVCHCGAGEAGSGTCFVKFAAARPGPDAGDRFSRLVGACEALARSRGLERMVAGVNLARDDAYRRLAGHGYRTWVQGVIMQRPNEPGYCRPDAYVIDDLR
jgi:GNAT superfamily N-acetyltransferase